MIKDAGFQPSLGSDNHSGVHPKILEAIGYANTSHAHSYGGDPLTRQAQEMFCDLTGAASAHFVFNGTAANVLCYGTMAKSFESVLCAEDSHAYIDECGACEKVMGIKTIPVPSTHGKVAAKDILPFLIRKGDQHYSQPRVLSITQPTEVGTVYSLEEMQELRKLCDDHQLYLHIDGARLIYAAEYLNCDFKTLLKTADAVSFGGTKNGLLFGEAVLFFREEWAKDFHFLRKQSLQLPSKMRFLGAQFLTLMKTNLWKEIAQHGHAMAKCLAEQVDPITQVRIAHPVQANSVFACVPQSWIKPLRKNHFFYVWDESDWQVRWMMSYNTKKQDIDSFVEALKAQYHEEVPLG